MGENSKIAIGVVITAIIMYGFNFITDKTEAGIDAEQRATMQEVVTDALKLDDGRTIGQAIQGIETEVGGVKVELSGVKGELKGIDRQLDALFE